MTRLEKETRRKEVVKFNRLWVTLHLSGLGPELRWLLNRLHNKFCE